MDTTPLPVKVREHLFGDAVSVHLLLALDVYTHSLAGFRLALVSDTSVDVAMLLRDVMTPTPLREEWGDDCEWSYPGDTRAGRGAVGWVSGGGAAVLHAGNGDDRPRVRLTRIIM